MLPQVVTYWHDHVQGPNPQTPSLLGFTATQAPSLMTLRSHSKVLDHLQLLIFVAITRFYYRLIVDLASVDSCVVRRYKTSLISQRVTQKSSKSLQNIARVSLLYVDKLDWNPKRFRGLGPGLKILQNLISMILDRLGLILDRLAWQILSFFFAVSSNLKLETYTFEQCLTHRLDMFFSRLANTQKW